MCLLEWIIFVYVFAWKSKTMFLRVLSCCHQWPWQWAINQLARDTVTMCVTCSTSFGIFLLSWKVSGPFFLILLFQHVNSLARGDDGTQDALHAQPHLELSCCLPLTIVSLDSLELVREGLQAHPKSWHLQNWLNPPSPSSKPVRKCNSRQSIKSA